MIIDIIEMKQRYLKRIAGARDKKIFIGPEVVTLNINTSCNLNCRFCGPQVSPNSAFLNKNIVFRWKKILGIVRDCIDLKVDQIVIMGTGEPTIDPLFRHMMRKLEQQPVYVKLFTNGTFPSEYCSDVIKGDHVVINLSTVDRQQYHDLQGGDFFNNVVANIKHLVALRDAYKPRFLIEIAYIVNAANINQKQKMQELASQLGVNAVHFRKMAVSDYNREIALPDGSPDAVEKRTPSLCLSGWFNLVLKLDGKTSASTCTNIHGLHFGDIDKLSLKEIWFSQHMMNVRLLGGFGQIQKMFKACQTCSFYVENVQRIQDMSGITL